MHSRFASSSAPSPPQERVARCREFWICKHITNCGEGAHVEVTTDEVDGVLDHVSMEAVQERGWSRFLATKGLSRT